MLFFCSLTPDLCPSREYLVDFRTYASMRPHSSHLPMWPLHPMFVTSTSFFLPLPRRGPLLHCITCGARLQQYPAPCLTVVTKLADANNTGTCNGGFFSHLLSFHTLTNPRTPYPHGPAVAYCPCLFSAWARRRPLSATTLVAVNTTATRSISPAPSRPCHPLDSPHHRYSQCGFIGSRWARYRHWCC